MQKHRRGSTQSLTHHAENPVAQEHRLNLLAGVAQQALVVRSMLLKPGSQVVVVEKQNTQCFGCTVGCAPALPGDGVRSSVRPHELAMLGAALVACNSNTGSTPDSQADSTRDTAGDTAGDTTGENSLEVVFLGVGGVSLRRGDDLLLTAPLFTNPSLLDVTLGDIVSDPAIIEQFLPTEEVENAAGILVGHAHYDHLLDVPHVQHMAGSDPVIYGNVSASNLLAGVEELGPLLAVNDPSDPRVDTRMCAIPDICTGVPAGQAGEWIEVPGTRARIRALCSSHPAQFLDIVHFGEGCVETPQALPPTDASEWMEGATLAWLVDFLDAEGSPEFRIYYQDASTNSPTGLVHPELLAERTIDLAVLNVGSFDAVRNHPAEALANLAPRYLLGVHWENFFQTQDLPLEPIPFHGDPANFDALALAAMPPGSEAPILVDGESDEGRYWRPDPGTRFVFARSNEESASAPTVPEARTESTEAALAFRTDLPAWTEDCETLYGAVALCQDVDADLLVDAWEDRLLEYLRPTMRFDEAEPLLQDDEAGLFAVGRVVPVADDHLRVHLMLGYRQDYGRCGLSSHPGDSERVVLDLAPLAGGGPGDVEVRGVYTAAHEGTLTDHGTLLEGDDLATAEFPVDRISGQPRWRVYPSDGKHATYPTVQLCEDAEWVPCLDEDCGPDNVDDLDAHDRLPPVVNAGEPDAPRLTDLAVIGFLDEDAWLDQEFCGGQGRQQGCSDSVRNKLVKDPFEDP